MPVLPDAHRATDLLERYAPGGATLLAFPTRTILAGGARTTVTTASADAPKAIAGAVRRTLDDREKPLVVGAVPFDPVAAAHLVVADEVAVADPLHLWPDEVGDPAASPAPRMVARPSREHYTRAVAQALPALRAGTLRKVVLARALDIHDDDGFDVPALVRALAARDPLAHVFAVDLPPQDDGPRTLIGASPELLVRRQATEVRTTPLAGSVPRDPDAVGDARRAAALMESPKDREEHAVVVEAVAAALRPFCDALEVPSGPELVRTATMWHLATRVRGRLADPDITSLELALALHPTPAVCGLPVARARDTIAALEPLDRGFYAGAVGWQDAHGDGEWAVTIRCGEVEGTRMRIWAGAGIVAASNPDVELRETAAKYRTLLSALGVQEVS